jgi:hypothetical protein
LEAIDFADYHRTVIGYHGTSIDAAERLVAGEDFQPSDEDDEWFGRGIYFWEHAHQQAWRWARKKHGPNASVIGAVLRLGYCFDLLDPGNAVHLKGVCNRMLHLWNSEHRPVPKNVRQEKRLDCAVFNFMYDEFEEIGHPLDTSRAAYVPTRTAKRVYPGSWISEETHIQICVRNPKSILAVWHVRQDGRYGRPTNSDK